MLTRAQAARKMNTSIIGCSISKQEVFDFIYQARKYPFAGLAVEATYLEYANFLLIGTPIRTVGVANYPLGGATISYALEMTKWCYQHGADEMDINLPVSLLRSNEFKKINSYLKEAVQIANGRILKGVIWSDEMTDQEIIDSCYLMTECSVDYVKTNPGFKHVTSPHVVPLIKNAYGDGLKVMVAGGVRNTQQMMEFFNLGADLVTTSTLGSVLKDLPES